MVGISVSATPFLYAALAHLRRTAHAVGGGQIPELAFPTGRKRAFVTGAGRLLRCRLGVDLLGAGVDGRKVSNSCQIHLGGVCRSPPWWVYPSPPHRSLYAALPICGGPRTRSEADKFPPPPALRPIPLRSSGVSIARSQKVVYDEISDVTTQSLAGRKIEEKMHPGKDAAQRCFFCGSRKACE